MTKQYEFSWVELSSVWGEHAHNKGGFIVSWGCSGIGFGELTFFINNAGKLCCDNECMSKEFVQQALLALTNTASFTD